MSNQMHELARWVRNQIFRARAAPLAKFVLRNANAGFRGAEVEEFELPPEQMDQDSVSAFTDQIVQAAQRDADASGTKLQTYLVMALELDRDTGPRHRFRIRGEGEEEDSGEEKPDKEGLISQVMRHNEALMRMATMGAQSTIVNLTRQLEAANTTIARLNEQRQLSLEVIEDAKSKQHEREMALLSAGNDEERRNLAFGKIAQKLDTLWPVIIGKLTGQKTISAQDNSVLTGFVNGLSQEQIAGIAQCLNNEQRITLMHLFRELKKNPAAAANGATGD